MTKIFTISNNILLPTLTAAVLLLTGCQEGIFPAEDLKQQPLSVVTNYAKNPDTTKAPDVEDYLALGIEGVTPSNVLDINLLIALVDDEDVDTQEELKDIIDRRQKALRRITAYVSDHVDAPAPTVETYWDLSITGVDASNLDAINRLVADRTVDEVDTIRELLVIIGGYTPAPAPAPTAPAPTTPTPAPTSPTPPTPVRAPNQAPTADAGADQKIRKSTRAQLRCIGHDPDGTDVSYKWMQGATQVGVGRIYMTPVLEPGTHTYTCVVTDDKGASAQDDVDVIVSHETLENLMHVTNDGGETKKIKILGIGSGGSHHLLFHHSDGKTVIENGDMGAMSISHDGGKTFQMLVSNVHAKDLGKGAEKYTLPRLFSIVEHPTHPDWLFGVATYGVLSFSTDRGKTWHSRNIGYGYLKTNKITIRQEGKRFIAYFASGYKLGTVPGYFQKLGVWVDITDIPHDITTFNEHKEYGVILQGKKNPTGLSGTYYYGDIVNLQGKLFVVGKGGLFVAEGDPKADASWKNITDSIFEHKEGVYPLDNGEAIGNKLYVLAFGDNDDTENTAGVYVHTKGDIRNGKYHFTRLYKGLNLVRFHKGNKFTRSSGALLKHMDTTNGKTYLYLIMQDVVYRLNVTDGSDTFERVTEAAHINGEVYSKGFIQGQRNTHHWSLGDNGSYTSFTESYQLGKMSFGTSYFPAFSGINTAYSYGGKIYVANTIEIKVSSDNGKTFDSYTSKVSNSGSEYDGKIKWYYGNISIYKDGVHSNNHKINISPTDDSVSFWWSGVQNRGMDNMVSTDIAINPDNPKEMMQTYMDSAAFFSNDSGESWHYTAGLRGILGDVYWTQWIQGSFYAQDRSGIYRFNKENLEFERLKDISVYMYLEESIRVRRYYDESSDTLVIAGYQVGAINDILVIKHFTDDSQREVKKITDIRKHGNGFQVTNLPGISRSFKDVYCDGEYVYAINAEFGVIKMPLNNLPDHYNDYGSGLDKDEYVFSGLFDRSGNAVLVTTFIDKPTREKKVHAGDTDDDSGYNAVIDDINGNADKSIATAEEINSISGVSGAEFGVNYLNALQAGSYNDSSNPTAEEIQKVLDDANLSGYKAVVDDINGNQDNTPATRSQINAIYGVSMARGTVHYLHALQHGNYADKTHPTAEEIQAVIDAVNYEVDTQKNYGTKYAGLIYTKEFKLKKTNIANGTSTVIMGEDNGLMIDGVETDIKKLTLLGIDPADSNRILASITGSLTVIESKDGGKTWNEFLPQISGNSHGNQSGNAVFAPNNSLYDVIILGNGSAYGVLK